MSEPKNQNAVVVKERGEVSYIPFGAQDPVRLHVGIVQSLCCEPTKSGKVCSDRDALRFIAMCSAKKLNPFEGDAFLIGYDTNDGPKYSLITAHQAFLKRAELHPEFDGMRSGLIVRDRQTKLLLDTVGDFYIRDEQELIGGWAIVYFKTRKIPMEKRSLLSTFNKEQSQWKTNPHGMICKVSEADALRSAFPTMNGGLYLRDELDIPDQRLIPSKPFFEKPTTTVNFPESKPILREELEVPPSGFVRPEPKAQPQTPGEFKQEFPPEPSDNDGGELPADAESVASRSDAYLDMPVPLGDYAGKLFRDIPEKERQWFIKEWKPNPQRPLQMEIRAALNLVQQKLEHQ